MIVSPAAIVAAAVIAVALPIERRTERIPNWLTYSGLAAVVVATAVFGEWATFVQGVLVAIVVSVPLFLSGCCGAGLLKLMLVGAAGAGWLVAVGVGALVTFWIAVEAIRSMLSRDESRTPTLHRGSPIVAFAVVVTFVVRWIGVLTD